MPFFDFRVGENIESDGGDIIQEIGDNQNARNIINAGKGNYFAHPTMGIGIMSHINKEFQLTEREALIRGEMKRDGFVVTSFEHFLDVNGNYVTDFRVEK